MNDNRESLDIIWRELSELEAPLVDPLLMLRIALVDLNRRLEEIESFLVISKETGR